MAMKRRRRRRRYSEAKRLVHVTCRRFGRLPWQQMHTCRIPHLSEFRDERKPWRREEGGHGASWLNHAAPLSAACPELPPVAVGDARRR